MKGFLSHWQKDNLSELHRGIGLIESRYLSITETDEKKKPTLEKKWDMEWLQIQNWNCYTLSDFHGAQSSPALLSRATGLVTNFCSLPLF